MVDQALSKRVDNICLDRALCKPGKLCILHEMVATDDPMLGIWEGHRVAYQQHYIKHESWPWNEKNDGSRSHATRGTHDKGVL